MKTLALIPARAGSKGVPHKNTKPLAGGLSCVQRAIQCVREIPLPITILVSTNDPEAQRQAEAAGVPTHARSVFAASDEANMSDVVADVGRDGHLQDIEAVLIVQPSSPLRDPKTLVYALALVQQYRETIMSTQIGVNPFVALRKHLELVAAPDGEPDFVRPFSASDWELRRQDCGPVCWRDGQVYAFRVECWRRQYGSIYSTWGRMLVTEPWHALSIDTEADWAEAERRLRERGP